MFQDRRHDLQLAAAVRAVFQTEIEHALEQLGPAQPHRAVMRAVRLALGGLCLLNCTCAMMLAGLGVLGFMARRRRS